ncbi:transforming growth factor beta receptor type 3-like [Tachypleus tridentatus]|uniref:transforming growth factor beta receptor type 3-like n=1 Tax=Tachypleus tridentatus TaxID=6853 RepID=UPI003FD3E662
MDFHIMNIFLLVAVARIHFIVMTKGKSVSDSPLSCTVKQHFQSQYVTPLLERISHVTGCTSQDISRNSKEVHVVSLESAGLNTTSLRGFLPRVSLKVKPRMENSLHVGPLVVVLNTATPVMWQLEVERISSNSRFVVFVTEESQVVPSAPLTLMVRQKQKAPLDKIVKWARSRFVALTSLSIIGIANTIVLKVGIDANYSETCEGISEKSVHNVEAFFIQPQPAAGCTVSENIGPTKRDVHVVKLLSTEEFSEVVVHLHPKGAAEARTSKIVVAKDLVLILKSDSAVKWRIDSWGIQGTVYVVAEHQVFPGSMPAFHLLQVQVRSLPLTLEELTLEVIDSNISTVIESWTVNRVNIMVVGEILGSNHYNVQSDGGSSRNKFSVGQDKAQPVLSHQTKLNTTAYPFTSWNHKIRNRNADWPWPFGHLCGPEVPCGLLVKNPSLKF